MTTPSPATPAAAPLPPDPNPTPPDRDAAARDAAARAHMAAFFNLVPLLGVFTAVGVYRTQQRESVWAARQALQAALFQFLSFNVALMLITLVAVIAVFAWESAYTDASLVLAVVLTVLPFYLGYYVLQAYAAWRAAAAVRRGDDHRYAITGRLAGPPT